MLPLVLPLCLLNCATTKPEIRPRPANILACPKLFEQVAARDAQFEAFRGKAFMKTKDVSVDLGLVMLSPHYMRVEVMGPLGVRVALLNVNKEWVQLYLPRDKELYRLPKSEFKEPTARREAFLRLLPLRIVPEFVPDFLSTRIGILESLDAEQGCLYSEKDNAYILRIAGSKMGRLVWVDPGTLAPLEQWVFQGKTPRPDADMAEIKPYLKIKYSKPRGEGYATLRSQIEVQKGADLEPFLTLQWDYAEAWPNPSESVFSWSAPASSSVKEY